MPTMTDGIGLGQSTLSALEQSSPRVWIRNLFCFSIEPSSSIEETTHVLSEALNMTLAELPFLKGQLVATTEGEQKGRLQIIPGSHSKFAVNNLKASPTCTLDYADLHVRHFPVSEFHADLLWPTAMFPTPGSVVPVFVAQANFIQGGLLLATSFWHMVIDGTGISTILKLWAQNCRRIQDINSAIAINFELSFNVLDKSRLDESPETHEGLLSEHPEYILLPEVPTTLPSFLTKILKTEVFYISPVSLASLKATVTPANNLTSSSSVWISTNDAVSALIWRSVTAATHCEASTTNKEDPTSCFQIAVNARSRTEPPLPADYLGCGLIFSTTNLPFSTILSPSSLSSLALSIRQSIAKVTPSYVSSLLGMLNRIPDFSRLIPLSFTDLLGNHSLVTSWSSFPIYEFEWGPALGGRCERVRAPWSGMFNGLQVVFPELPKSVGGGWEVMIGLEEEAMERLGKDEVWKEFTVAR